MKCVEVSISPAFTEACGFESLGKDGCMRLDNLSTGLDHTDKRNSGAPGMKSEQTATGDKNKVVLFIRDPNWEPDGCMKRGGV